LEQLLRIEVEATEQRRWEGRMQFANFPAPWAMSDFDFADQPSVEEAFDPDRVAVRDLCRVTASV
jgi:DNA replication protein DnaC